MINSKRGSIEAMGERGQARVITAKVEQIFVGCPDQVSEFCLEVRIVVNRKDLMSLISALSVLTNEADEMERIYDIALVIRRDLELLDRVGGDG